MTSIVIVEDSNLVRKGLRHMISRFAEEVEVIGDAADGIAGKSMILERRPQIILTDIRLPGISGLQMIREIQEVYTPQIIIISGYSEFEYARQALSLGVIAYLVKPIDEKELEQKIQLAISRVREVQYIPAEETTTLQADGTNDIPSNATRVYYANQVLSYIHAHFADDFKIPDLAKDLNMSESHLSRLFKEQTSYTIHEYRSCYCIAQAAKLLADPKYKIYEIAQMVGFDNQRYFSLLFKRKMNMTPMEYRNATLVGHDTASGEQQSSLVHCLIENL